MRGVRCEIWKNCNGSNKGAATQMAILYGLLGETDRAFACLEEAYRYRQPLLLLANVQPRMDCLRSDPRLREMLAKLNWPFKMHSSAEH